jgi:hypothetical protein
MRVTKTRQVKMSLHIESPVSSKLLIPILILSLLCSKSFAQKSESITIPETELFDPKKCPFDKLRAPIELNGVMKYDDFTVKLDFKSANSIVTTKMDDSSYRIDGNNFGYIAYDDKQYTVERVYVKSPSDHKIEGSYLHGELQVVATSGTERLVLTKLLQEVPAMVAGY